MVEENINQEFRLKNIDETRNYFIKEIDQNELMSKKHKKVYTTLNYTEVFLILAPASTGYIPVYVCYCMFLLLCLAFLQQLRVLQWP